MTTNRIMIIKEKARKPLTLAKPSTIGIALSGVGGIANEPVAIITIGDYRLCISMHALDEINKTIAELTKVSSLNPLPG